MGGRSDTRTTFTVMFLHQLIASRRTEIIARWSGEASGKIAPSGLGHVELVDDIPGFLEELGCALAEQPRAGMRPTETVQTHGRMRLRLGFNIAAVVQEFDLLRRCIVAIAKENGVRPSEEESDRLCQYLATGLATAASEYVGQRDAEAQRQATEHFAFIAHELRNPLGAARLAMEILRRSGALPLGGAATVVKRSLARMTDLIDRSLQLASRGNALQIVRTEFDLGALLQEVTELAELHAVERRIALRLAAGKGPLSIAADRRLVESAVTNLLRNALKFSREGGTVELRAKREDGTIRIEVEDSCGGLPPGAVEKVFAPFVQLATGKEGFGLGLAIARQAAEAHGGMIAVHDLPGKGCIFELVIPSVAEAA